MSLRNSPQLTPQSLDAARSNARRSHGPRTAAGKENCRDGAYRDYMLEREAPPEPGPEHYQELLRLLEEERAAVEEAFQHEVEVEEEKAAIDRDACLAPSGEEWKLMLRREETLDRSIDRKIKLLLSLRKGAPAKDVGAPLVGAQTEEAGGQKGRPCGERPACDAKIDDRSGNVDENKGLLTSAAGQREVPAPSEQQMGDARVGITVA